MPIIRIEMVEGRDTAQKRELADVFTREMARICGCSESAIHIVFDDIKKQDWAIGGQLLHEKAQG